MIRSAVQGEERSTVIDLLTTYQENMMEDRWRGYSELGAIRRMCRLSSEESAGTGGDTSDEWTNHKRVQPGELSIIRGVVHL